MKIIINEFPNYYVTNEQAGLAYDKVAVLIREIKGFVMPGEVAHV